MKIAEERQLHVTLNESDLRQMIIDYVNKTGYLVQTQEGKDRTILKYEVNNDGFLEVSLIVFLVGEGER